MFSRLWSVLSALAVGAWLLSQGASLVVFANGINTAYASTDLTERVGTVADKGFLPFVARDTVALPEVGTVKVAPDPAEPVEVGEPRTILFDRDRLHVARYKHAELTSPGARYYVAGSVALILGLISAAVGVRGLFKILDQRTDDVDEERVRFASHHRHGA